MGHHCYAGSIQLITLDLPRIVHKSNDSIMLILTCFVTVPCNLSRILLSLTPQDGQKYHVLCVITDGIINDMVR